MKVKMVKPVPMMQRAPVNTYMTCETPEHSGPRYEAAARLRLARQNAGFRSAREFAETYGFNPTTCSHHENGQRTLLSDPAREYARYLGVTPAWLLFGDTSKTRGSCIIIGSVTDGSVTLLDRREGEAPVEVPGANEDYDITTVEDQSMEPFAFKGDLVYFKPARPLAQFDRNDIDNNYCVVSLLNGATFVRRVIVVGINTATLLSLDGRDVMSNVTVKSVAPIEWVRKMRARPPEAECHCAA